MIQAETILVKPLAAAPHRFENRWYPAEQLQLAEQIWDNLLVTGQLLQQWQLDEDKRRCDELDANPSIALTHEEMWDQVNRLRNE